MFEAPLEYLQEYVGLYCGSLVDDFLQKHSHFLMHSSLQGGPLLVTNGVISPISMVITSVTRPFIGVISPFITGRGPPCIVHRCTIHIHIVF